MRKLSTVILTHDQLPMTRRSVERLKARVAGHELRCVDDLAGSVRKLLG